MTVSQPDSQPAPLLGCLYCHTEGSTTLSEGRKILGFGSNLPTLTCSNCGSVAQFEYSTPENGTAASVLDPDHWRIRYKKVNKASRYYYVMIYLGNAGWLDADKALEISRTGYVQRQRVVQAQRGELAWLCPAPLDPPPPLMEHEELVYLTVNPATLQHDNQSVLDSGRFYLTDRKLHLLGHRRDWSHKFSDIQNVEHTEQWWRIHIGGSTAQYYQGLNTPDQIDAQLFAAIVKNLAKQEDTNTPKVNVDDLFTND